MGGIKICEITLETYAWNCGFDFAKYSKQRGVRWTCYTLFQVFASSKVTKPDYKLLLYLSLKMLMGFKSSTNKQCWHRIFYDIIKLKCDNKLLLLS